MTNPATPPPGGARRDAVDSPPIAVDQSRPEPPFDQVRSQVASQITDGSLVAGARLPTVRRLAGDLGLAVNTVARAYRELEEAGLVETRGRAGTFVRGQDASRALAASAAREFATRMRGLGVGPDEAVALLRAAYDSP